MMSTDQKGNIAEAAVVLAAVKLGVEVYRPIDEGGRCDLIFGIGRRLLRVQCKRAPREGDVVIVRCYSCRRNRDGLLRRRYERGEIDAFAAYCSELEDAISCPSSCSRAEVRFRSACNRRTTTRGGGSIGPRVSSSKLHWAGQGP